MQKIGTVQFPRLTAGLAARSDERARAQTNIRAGAARVSLSGWGTSYSEDGREEREVLGMVGDAFEVAKGCWCAAVGGERTENWKTLSSHTSSWQLRGMHHVGC